MKRALRGSQRKNHHCKIGNDMRRLTSIALLLLALAATPTFADCTSHLIYGGSYRHSAVDVATQYGV